MDTRNTAVISDIVRKVMIAVTCRVPSYAWKKRVAAFCVMDNQGVCFHLDEIGARGLGDNQNVVTKCLELARLKPGEQNSRMGVVKVSEMTYACYGFEENLCQAIVTAVALRNGGDTDPATVEYLRGRVDGNQFFGLIWIEDL